MVNNTKFSLKKRLNQWLTPKQYANLKALANFFLPRMRAVTLMPEAGLTAVRGEEKEEIPKREPISEDIETLKEKIARVSWYHSYELLPALVTPGIFPIAPAEILDFHQVPQNLTRKKVLDIGTWDGPMAFEFERRGAKVTALDIQDPDCTGFNTAKAILRSRIPYIQASVYDLSQVLREKFDIICFFGVFYHLKSPLLAFEEITKVLAEEGFLLFEGECLLNYAETLDNQPIRGAYWWQWGRKLKSKKVREISAIANSDFPLTLCYPGRYQGTSNWFIPNLSCIFSWLEANGLEMVSYRLDENLDRKPFPTQRIRAVARKSHHSPLEEHPVVPQHWR